MYGLGKALGPQTLAKIFSKSLLTSESIKLLLTNDNFFLDKKMSSYFKDQFFSKSINKTFYNFLITFHSPIYLYPKNDLYISSFIMLNNVSKIFNLSELTPRDSTTFTIFEHLKSSMFLSSFFYIYFLLSGDSDLTQSPWRSLTLRHL
jgi:hypothetical protein